MSKIPTQWLRHCETEEQKEEFKKFLANSQGIFDVLDGILADELDKLERCSKKDYDKASWPYYQAHQNGEREAIDRLRRVLPKF